MTFRLFGRLPSLFLVVVLLSTLGTAGASAGRPARFMYTDEFSETFQESGYDCLPSGELTVNASFHLNVIELDGDRVNATFRLSGTFTFVTDHGVTYTGRFSDTPVEILGEQSEITVIGFRVLGHGDDGSLLRVTEVTQIVFVDGSPVIQSIRLIC